MALFGYNNATDNATVSATNATGSLPPANVQDADIGTKVFRTTANSTELDLQFAAAVSRQVIVLVGTNLTSGASITLDAGTGGAGSSDVVSGFTDFKISEDYNVVIGEMASEASATDWRLTLSDSSLSAIDIGRVGLLKSLSLSHNIAPGYTLESLSMTTARRMRGNQLRRYRRRTYYGAETYKRVTFDWEGLAPDDAIATAKDKLVRLVGQSEDILFVEDLKDSNWAVHAVWGNLSGLPSMTAVTKRAFDLEGFEIEEQL